MSSGSSSRNELATQLPWPSAQSPRFALGFTALSGLRWSELTAAKLEWLRHKQLDDAWAWSRIALGARGKCGEVTLLELASESFREYQSGRSVRVVCDGAPGPAGCAFRPNSGAKVWRRLRSSCRPKWGGVAAVQAAFVGRVNR